MAASFDVSGTEGADELVVPWVFTATATGAQTVVLYGEDITANVSANYVINLNVSTATLENTFTYTTPQLGSDPTYVAFSLSGVSHAFDTYFVGKNTTVGDDIGSNVPTPYGDFRGYIEALSSWTGLHARDDVIKSESDTQSCDHLLGSSSVVKLGPIINDFSGALAALYERAAAAGKINTAGESQAATWDLSAGDKVTVYVKYTEARSINYEFDSNASGLVDASFNATSLGDINSITVFYGDSATPVTIADASNTTTKLYKMTLTAV